MPIASPELDDLLFDRTVDELVRRIPVYAPESKQVVRRRCDGSTVLLVRQPGVLLRPAGLALDARGFLFVADPPARRVVVLWPEDGSVRGVITAGLVEPIDVAVSAAGVVEVADRRAGVIALFDRRLNRVGGFPTVPVPPRAEPPEPVGVAFAADGSVLVIDAIHPRVLRFDPTGRPLADLSPGDDVPAADEPASPRQRRAARPVERHRR